MKHIVVMPAHNEAALIARTLQSIADQTLPPDRLVVVDDSSTDATADIVREFIARYPWISLVSGPSSDGERRYRVVEVFNKGYEQVRGEKVEYISKLDADLVFPPDYFERLFGAMDADPTIGAAGGEIEEVGANGRRHRLRIPENHVVGALKTIRKRVFEEMGGFVPMLGWDIVDLVKIRSMGYRTVCVSGLKVVHLRQTAAATGILRGNVRMGHGAYVIGTHPLFALARVVYRMFDPPYVLAGLALGYGYFRSWLKGAEQMPDRALIDALRAEQLHRLAHFNRTPAPRATLHRRANV
jgi:glycosyltransferase involved in cell wall biosynthesis